MRSRVVMLVTLVVIAVSGVAAWGLRGVLRPETAIPKHDVVAPPVPVHDATDTALVLTLAVELTVRGKPTWTIARLSTNGEQTLVMATDGRIPVFPTEGGAREWASRVLPTAESRRQQDSLEALAMQYVGRHFRVNLDRAYAWSMAPTVAGMLPVALVQNWLVLSLGSQLPGSSPTYQLGMRSIDTTESRYVSNEERALMLTIMKVNLLVSAGSTISMDADSLAWPTTAGFWTAGDAARIGKAFRSAIPAFVARLSTDIDGITRELVARRRRNGT